MGTNIIVYFLCAFTLILHSSLHYEVAAGDVVAETRRQELEIIIGGGGYGPAPAPEYCPPPPPPPEPICPTPPPPPPPPEPICPPPLPPPPFGPFASERIQLAFKVIQRFKNRITYDPQGIAKTWVGPDVCNKYKGFVCDVRPDIKKKAVAGVDFNGYRFNGPDFSLSDFLEKLEDLAIFHANSNNFTKSIPKMTSKLKFLYELDVSNNKLFGGFPMEVVNIKNLTFLDIRFNSFSGPVPAEIFYLDLDVLFLNNNKFSQNLPENIGSTGALYVTFANNEFTGCLPYEIGFLRNSTVFDVGNNRLTGPIPHSFGCLSGMQFLNLAMNQFYGPVPEIVCQLPKLVNLSLSYNYFTQVGPECRKLIKRKVLDVRMNCILDLPNQRSQEECGKFFSESKKCPNERSLTLVPCARNRYTLNSTETFDKKLMAPAPSPRTYDALKKHF
ncbi:hypothetical protein AB3S75_040758 [Citrus x aurantiifolia]